MNQTLYFVLSMARFRNGASWPPRPFPIGILASVRVCPSPNDASRYTQLSHGLALPLGFLRDLKINHPAILFFSLRGWMSSGGSERTILKTPRGPGHLFSTSPASSLQSYFATWTKKWFIFFLIFLFFDLSPDLLTLMGKNLFSHPEGILRVVSDCFYFFMIKKDKRVSV